MQKLRYKFIYWKRVVHNGLGFCHRCLSRVNFTSQGRPICPMCGR